MVMRQDCWQRGACWQEEEESIGTLMMKIQIQKNTNLLSQSIVLFSDLHILLQFRYFNVWGFFSSLSPERPGKKTVSNLARMAFTSDYPGCQTNNRCL